MMGKIVRIVAVLQLLALASLAAQRSPGWLVRGDTSGAPRGCSAAAGIAAITQFAAAMNAADSVGLSRAWAVRRPGGLVFTLGRVLPTDTVFQARSLAELLHYARARARHHERMTVQAVTFNGWWQDGLQIGPIYVKRTADDFGGSPRYSMGKGMYLCGQGIGILGLSPRPVLRPGQRMIESQAYPPDDR